LLNSGASKTILFIDFKLLKPINR